MHCHLHQVIGSTAPHLPTAAARLDAWACGILVKSDKCKIMFGPWNHSDSSVTYWVQVSVLQIWFLLFSGQKTASSLVYIQYIHVVFCLPRSEWTRVYLPILLCTYTTSIYNLPYGHHFIPTMQLVVVLYPNTYTSNSADRGKTGPRGCM